MSSVPASALHVAQQTAKAATALEALAQVQANKSSQQAQTASKPQASNPPGVGGRVDRTA
jgi:hypothetical protein